MKAMECVQRSTLASDVNQINNTFAPHTASNRQSISQDGEVRGARVRAGDEHMSWNGINIISGELRCMLYCYRMSAMDICICLQEVEVVGG